MKKLTVLLTLLAALMLAVPCFAAEPAEGAKAKPEGGVIVADCMIKYPGVELTYPAVVGMEDAKRQAAINKIIKENIQEFTDTYIKEIKAGQMSIQSEYKVHYNKYNLLSLTLLRQGYPQRAAHGFQEMVGMVFDVYKGTRVTRDDLRKMKEGARYDKVFAPANVNAKLREANLAGEIQLFNHFSGVTVEPQEWFLDENLHVNAVYQPYEVAPYACGFVIVDLEKKR